MLVWVTRDVEVIIWGEEPERDTVDNIFDGNDCLYQYTEDEFKTLYGFTPRMGSCKQMELSLKGIE